VPKLNRELFPANAQIMAFHCQWCGVEAHAHKSTAKYCSDLCRHNAYEFRNHLKFGDSRENDTNLTSKSRETPISREKQPQESPKIINAIRGALLPKPNIENGKVTSKSHEFPISHKEEVPESPKIQNAIRGAIVGVFNPEVDKITPTSCESPIIMDDVEVLEKVVDKPRRHPYYTTEDCPGGNFFEMMDWHVKHGLNRMRTNYEPHA
jgi:hypothetical protein